VPKLATALNHETSNAVGNLFGGTQGIATVIDSHLTSELARGGPVSSRSTSLVKQEDALTNGRPTSIRDVRNWRELDAAVLGIGIRFCRLSSHVQLFVAGLFGRCRRPEQVRVSRTDAQKKNRPNRPLTLVSKMRRS